MRRFAQRISVVFASVIVIFVGFSTLLGLLIGDVAYNIPANVPLVGGAAGNLQTDDLALIFVRVAVVTVALTIVIGVINLVAVNLVRILRGRTLTARLNSLVVIASFVAALLFYVGNRTVSLFLLEDVQVPIESALAGLVFFSLVYGAFRILRNGVTAAGLLFVLTVEIVLLGALPLPGIEPIRNLTTWLMQVPVNAGARGILLGIALATLVTGLRVLIGQDRTYGE